jgi:hypothetical protein
MSGHARLHSQVTRVSVHLHYALLNALREHEHQAHSSAPPLLTISPASTSPSAPVDVNLVLTSKVVITRLESRSSSEECDVQVVLKSARTQANSDEENDVKEWGNREYEELFVWLGQVMEERLSGEKEDEDEGKDRYQGKGAWKRGDKRRDSLGGEWDPSTKSLAQEFDALDLDADDRLLVQGWRWLIVEEEGGERSLAEELEMLDLDRADWELVRMWRGDGIVKGEG